MTRLRYPGHDTLGCFSSSRPCRPALNSKLAVAASSVSGMKAVDNVGEERHQAESGLMRHQARKGTPKKEGLMLVFVLDRHKRPLMPCSEKRARLLLKRGRAVVHRVEPFTIRLKDRTVNFPAGKSPPSRVGMRGGHFSKFVNSLKSVSARLLFREFPELKRELWNGHFWSPSYFLATVGEVKLEDVKRYVQSQGSA